MPRIKIHVNFCFSQEFCDHATENVIKDAGRDHGSLVTFSSAWSHSFVKAVTMVTLHQFNGSKPPNNPNLDTRLGLLLFVQKARIFGQSALVPVGLCPSDCAFRRAFFMILGALGLWGVLP